MIEVNQREVIKKTCSLLIKSAENVAYGKRTPLEVKKLFLNLLSFNRIPTVVNDVFYPGRFGNRCVGCGHCLDEFGVCPCGWDHDFKIKIR